MDRDVILFLSEYFRQIWRLFSEWRLPGLNFTPASMFLFFVVARLTIPFVLGLLSQSFDDFADSLKSRGR